MLKWAFNEPRQSYLPNSSNHSRAASLNELSQIPPAAFYAQTANTPTTHLSRWQSVDHNCLQPIKESQITSTPLPACSSPQSSRQLSKDELCPRKLDCLEDVSNIHPEPGHGLPHIAAHRTPPKRQQNRNASTLPTLEVNEYSPSSALIPGPILALRGIGIPDAYFDKPRYLETTSATRRVQHDTNPKPSTNCAVLEVGVENSISKSLSSSQMDDSTLERMIDAIIASSHKEPKMATRLYRHSQAAVRSSVMSPTYTPAYDPASDLDEVWWSAERRYRQGNEACHQPPEQLLCTPTSQKSQLLEPSFKRRRQRPVRRKRKLKSFRRTVQNSARKLLRVGSNVSVVMPQLSEVDERSGEPSRVSLSPDSGHNSSSGDSTKTEDHEGHHHKALDAHAASDEVEVTKRRLSFFKNPL